MSSDALTVKDGSTEHAEPDVWWGEGGIDTLIWVDPIPYKSPTAPRMDNESAAQMGGSG